MVRSLSGVAAWALVLLSCLCADRSDAVAQDLVQRVAQHSRLYLPPGSGPFQTIVAIPGCSGVSFDSPRTDEGRPGREGDRLFRRFYPQMSDRLSQSGFAVLLVDYLSAEEVSNTCSGEIDLSRVAAYIGAALQFAGTLGAIERSRIHLGPVHTNGRCCDKL